MTSSCTHKHGFIITLAWIQDPVGIGGNEAADAVARDATIQGILVPGVLSVDYKITSICLPVVLPWMFSCHSFHCNEVVVTHLWVGCVHLTCSHLLSTNRPMCAPCNIP